MTDNVKKLLNIKELLEKNDITGIYSETEKYAHGPLGKNKETLLFEEIVHELINDHDKNKENQRITIDRIDKKFFVSRKDEVINLQDLLNKVNFNQLEISKKDIAKYAGYISKAAPNHEHFKKLIEKADTKQADSLKELEYGEMLSIYKYTGSSFLKGVNNLFRNCNSLSKLQLLNFIPEVAIASHGLNKLPDIDLPEVIRNEDDYNLNTFKQNVKDKKVTQEKAFISTSYINHKDFDRGKKGIKIVYKNVKGKNISSISSRPDEQEYLIPPSTQLKWTGYIENPHGYIFTAEGANVLIDQGKIQTVINQIEKVIEKKEKIFEENVVLNIKKEKPPIAPKPEIFTHITPNSHTITTITTINLKEIEVKTIEAAIKQIVDIVENNDLINSKEKEKYFKSKLQKDIKNTQNSNLPFKHKLYKAAQKVFKFLGLVSLDYYMQKKIEKIYEPSTINKVIDRNTFIGSKKAHVLSK